MLKFKSNYNNNLSIIELRTLTYTEMLKIECEFSIMIDNEVFFEENLFPILEFLHFYVIWRDENQILSSDFNYSSLETEDNPLISFVESINGWRILSPWSKFEYEKFFELKDIVMACDELLNNA